MTLRAIAGHLLLAMTICAVLAPFRPDGYLSVLSGAFAWTAMLLLLPQLAGRHALLSAMICLIGLLLIVLFHGAGAGPSSKAVLYRNTPLLALLVGVSYLRQVMPPAEAESGEMSGSGPGALWRYMMTTHLLAAVINLSAVFIVLDRNVGARNGEPCRLVPVARAFGAAAFWSPFFVAMGVALTYAPGSKIQHLMLMGVPPAICVLLLTLVEYELFRRECLASSFRFPFSRENLLIPMVLVGGVIVAHHNLPGYPVVLVVAALSVALAVLAGVRDGHGRLLRHTTDELPHMAGELALFLSAGVLSVGIGQASMSMDLSLIHGLKDFPLAAGTLVLILSLSLTGIHPLIVITATGSALPPGQAGDLMGITFLLGWGLGIISGPLSGLNLAIQGRYQVGSRLLLSRQWAHVLAMTFVSVMMLGIYDTYLVHG